MRIRNIVCNPGTVEVILAAEVIPDVPNSENFEARITLAARSCDGRSPMTTAPTPKRRRRTKDLGPPCTGTSEKATLLGMLDYLRNSIAGKVADVPEPEVRSSGVPSGTNLLGLIKHLTYVERFYFLGEPIENLRRTMRPDSDETVDGLLTDYRQTNVQVNQVIEACTDLALPAPRPPGRGLGPSMRWALVHLIEETAGTPATPTSCANRSTAPPAADPKPPR